MLTISGERPSGLPLEDDKVNIYGNERFAGPFRRAVSLPDDIDSTKVKPITAMGCCMSASIVANLRCQSALPFNN